jgi:hypothetical protein
MNLECNGKYIKIGNRFRSNRYLIHALLFEKQYVSSLELFIVISRHSFLECLKQVMQRGMSNTAVTYNHIPLWLYLTLKTGR